LGDCYRYGIGVEENASQAFAWYRKSVSVGGVLSDELTMMTPLLLDRESKESEDEYRRRSLAPKATATAGLPALELGDRYWNGIGVEQDLEKAEFWRRRSKLLRERWGE
jgi:TPR repeat protein